MMRTFLAALLLGGLVVAGTVRAGIYNSVLNLGDAAPAWTDLPGVDGRKHALADLKDKDVVVVVFTCNSCPIAVDYEDRILAFHKKHCGPDQKAALVAINVNTIKENKLEVMKERAKERGFTFPYLFDGSQKIARDYGAIYTPEFFVLNKQRRIVYMGAMDDKNTEKLAKENFLEPALRSALKGEPAKIGETLGRGCRIRFLRKSTD